MATHKEIPKIDGGLPIIGHTIPFLKNPTNFLEKAYKTHGNIFSMRLSGHKSVVMLGPENNKFFFDETDKLLSIKAAYPFFARMFSPDFFSLADAKSYRQQRGIILPCFRATVMPNYIDIMVKETNKFIEKLGDSGSFDLNEEFGPLVMKIAAHSFFGNDFKEKLGDSVFEDFREFSKGLDPVIPGWLPLPKFKASQKAKKKLTKNLLDTIKERKKNPVSPPDFLQTLIESKNEDGSKVDDHILVNLVLLMVWAGHETTTGHISWALIDLLQNPDYLESVLEEQQNVLQNNNNPTMGEARKLKLIEWSIKESERLHPVAMVIFRKAKETFERDGYLIKKNTMVYISPTLSHRMPEVFPNPDQYNPLRFSEGKQIKNSLIGFGGGLHRCTGINFAYLEMKLVLTLLLQHYDFELVNKNPGYRKGVGLKWPEKNSMVKYTKKKIKPKMTQKVKRKTVEEAVY